MTRCLISMTMIALTLLTACRKEAGKSANDRRAGESNFTGYLDVIDDPSMVEAARRLAKSEQPVPLSPESLNDVWSISRDVIPADMDADEAMRRLQRVVSTVSASARNRTVAACLAMLLDPDKGQALFHEILTNGSVESQRRALIALIVVSPGQLKVTDTRLADLIASRITNPALGSDAVRACVVFDIPNCRERFWSAYPNADFKTRTAILRNLCAEEPGERIFNACQELMAEADDQQRESILGVLELLLDCRDESVTQRACDLLASDLLSRLESEDVRRFDFPQSAGVKLLERGEGPKVEALAQRILEKSPDPYLRMCAYERARRLEGEHAIPRLLADIRKPEMLKTALMAIKELFKDSHHELLVDGLMDAMRDTTKPSDLSELAKALLDVGGERAEAELRVACQRLPEFTRDEILAQLDAMPATRMVELLHELDIVNAKDPLAFIDQMRKERGADNIDADGELDLLSILHASGNLAFLDVETGVIPVRHDRLIGELGKGSGGAFQPTACLEQMLRDDPEDWDAPYRVQFIFGNRLYRFAARNLGDWYDLERVVTVCNRALKDSGSPRRFFAMATGGQLAGLTCLTPTQAAALARLFHVTWSDELGAAMESGKAYEDEVIRRLQKDGEVIRRDFHLPQDTP